MDYPPKARHDVWIQICTRPYRGISLWTGPCLTRSTDVEMLRLLRLSYLFLRALVLRAPPLVTTFDPRLSIRLTNSIGLLRLCYPFVTAFVTAQTPLKMVFVTLLRLKPHTGGGYGCPNRLELKVQVRWDGHLSNLTKSE